MAKKTSLPRTPRPINRHVRPVHFEDFSGPDFERLVLAYVLRRGYPNPEWLGESGGDQGRDIWCTGGKRGATVFLCANYQKLTFGKVSSDLQKLTAGRYVPARVIVVGGGKVSATLREKIKAEAERLGFVKIEVWSGAELEERIRHHAPDLLKRFCEGESFPDTAAALAAFIEEPAEESALPRVLGKLCQEAKDLLLAMAETEDGDVLRTETMDGYGLTIGGKDFVPDTKLRRVKARWEHAINELLEHQLLKEEGSRAEVFGLTASGFAAADRLRPLSVRSTTKRAEFQPEVMPDPAAYFRAMGPALTPETPFDNGPLNAKISSRPATCLRLYPLGPVLRIPSALAAKQLAEKGCLRPMGVELSGASWIRNEKGALAFTAPTGNELENFTQLFLTGEICGLDLRLVRRAHQNSSAGEVTRRYLLVYYAEASCALALRDYMRFSRLLLQHPAPLRVEASLHGVKDCELNVGLRSAGQSLEPTIAWAGTIPAGEEDPVKILAPFFFQVWETFGITRFPDADVHLRRWLAS